MSNSSKGFLSIFIDFLSALFAGKKSTSASPASPADSSTPEPAVIVSPRVLVVVYDPVVDASTGEKLSQKMNWYSVDSLTANFLADIQEVSDGLGRFQLVDRVDLDEFPVKADGFCYTPQSYLGVMNSAATHHEPDLVDYQKILTALKIMDRVASNEIDEVWAFGFPYAGFWESTMGGVGAFFCNSDPLPNTSSCPRRFVIMGFSYERGPGEMLHSFGHRCESIMARVYAPISANANMWQQFTRYDKTSPGKAQVGTVHFAPNSQADYDYGNQRFVPSNCDDWYNYPNFKGITRQVNCAEWGNGDIRSMHKWWLKHFPKRSSETNGIADNWWQYVLDPNRVQV